MRNTRPSWTSFAAVSLWIIAVPAGLGLAFGIDRFIRDYPQTKDAWLTPGLYSLVVAAAACGSVGMVIALRRPRHPVGWLFLTLSLLITTTGVVDGWLAYALLVQRDGALLPRVVASLDRAEFVFWLQILAFALLLTPTGHLPSRRWRPVAWLIAVVPPVGFLLILVTPGSLASPLQTEQNVLGWSLADSAPFSVARAGAGFGPTLLLVVAAASLFVRFRGAEPLERQQLKWVALGAASIPLIGVAQFVFVVTHVGEDRSDVLGAMAGVFLAAIPIATGVAILQYRLYDLGVILSRAVTWVILTIALGGLYVCLVLLAGVAFSGVGDSSAIGVGLATAAVALAFSPGRRRLQDVVDRRFNRRRWDAVRLVTEFTGRRTNEPRATIDAVLARALQAPDLSVSYYLAGRAIWVDAGGQEEAGPSLLGSFVVERDGRVIAALSGIPPDGGQESTVRAVASAAAPELESAGLRAEVRAQVLEVQASRGRIVAAADRERRRIERNLHDGAQQRLVTIALELRGTLASGGETPAPVRAAVERSIADLHLALRELRELASGLHPAILSRHGLAAAIEDLADRVPLPVTLELEERRLPGDIEAAGYFVACEAVANAVKHAGATTLHIRTARDNGRFTLEVADDGAGGATFDGGHGLRGLADRVDAVFGELILESPPRGGTRVRAEFPCAS